MMKQLNKFMRLNKDKDKDKIVERLISSIHHLIHSYEEVCLKQKRKFKILEIKQFR